MELEALIRALAPSEVTGARPVEIGDVAYDTRRVTKGALFFCVRGTHVDGHELAWEAVERGAAALVVERELDVRVPQLVVADTRAAMAVAADAFFFTLAQVDVHDMMDGHTPKEKYILDARKYGVKKNRARVLVRRDEVVSLSLLEDVIDY